MKGNNKAWKLERSTSGRSYAFVLDPDYNDRNGGYANASHQRTVFSANPHINLVGKHGRSGDGSFKSKSIILKRHLV